MSNGISKRKKIGNIIGICIASVLIIIAFCGRYFNSGFKHFANFFVGSFGMSFYGIMAGIIVSCSLSLAGKTIKVPRKYIVHFALLFLSIILCVHILTTTYLVTPDINGKRYTFGEYISCIYNYYGDGFGIPSFGGVVFGIIAFALEYPLTIYGAMIIVVALMAWCVFVVGEFFYSYFTGKLELMRNPSSEADILPSETTTDAQPDFTAEEFSRKRAEDILFSEQETMVYPDVYKTKYDVAPKSTLDDTQPTSADQLLFGTKKQTSSFFDQTPTSETSETSTDTEVKDDFIVKGYRKPTEEKIEEEKPSTWEIFNSSTETEETSKDTTVKSDEVETATKPTLNNPIIIDTSSREEEIDSEDLDVLDVVSDDESEDYTETFSHQVTDDDSVTTDLDDVVEDDDTTDDYFEDDSVSEDTETELLSVNESVDDDEIIAVETETPIGDGVVQTGLEFMSRGELEKRKQTVHQYMKYNIPPFDLLEDVMIVEDLEGDDRQRTADAIVNKLAVFGIKIQLADIVVGPSVTRYMFQVLSQKTRMGAFTQYADDIKACVEAQEDIRIEAPVHGTNMVGIEIANRRKSKVLLRSLLESKEFQQAKGNLVFAIGQEITGKVVIADLADMPHLLIAGATGSGKSVCLNCLIVSLMYKYGPEYLRFVMIDPKYVELSRYNGIPHMLTTETLTNVQDALAGMDYLIKEMDARYQLFRQNGVGNITEYNSRINPKLTQRLPYLVFVVDELADLMSISKQAFESKLGRLAQKSRAAGIHIVLATQRPDKNIITGTIKVNLPCRMALKVSSAFDSSTIINGGGAEKLLGRGDMLFRGVGTSDLERVQGAYISNDEINDLVEFSKASNEIYYDSEISEEIFVSRKAPEEKEPESKTADKESQLDPYCKKALRFWLEKNHGKASIASIQRALSIGFNRAGRIMDSLQKLKYVEEPSDSDTSQKPLRVLVTLDQLDDLFPDMEG